jgi:hypothetical protein
LPPLLQSDVSLVAHLAVETCVVQRGTVIVFYLVTDWSSVSRLGIKINVSLAVIVFYFYVLVVVLLVYISTIDLMPVRIQQQRALQEIINDISNKLLKQIKKEYVGRLKKFKCSSVDGKHPLVRFSTY